jgi:hypothetical protein
MELLGRSRGARFPRVQGRGPGGPPRLGRTCKCEQRARALRRALGPHGQPGRVDVARPGTIQGKGIT